MNNHLFRAALYLLGAALSLTFGAQSGQWFAAFVILFVVDSLLQSRQRICFNNALGTLSASIIVRRALELVFTKRPILNNVSLGFQDLDTGSLEAKFNQQVITRTFGVPPVNDFGTGAQDRADVDVPVTLNKFKEIHHVFTPQEYSGTNRNLLDESAEPIAVAFANHMVDAIAALWTAANFPTNTVVGAGWSYTNTLLELRAALVGRGVPMGGRWFNVNNTNVTKSLLADPLVVAALNNPNNGGAIASGRLPMTAGLALDEYPALPVAGNLIGFAGAPDSCVYAARVPTNPESLASNLKYPGNLEIVTEPRTGLSVMLNEWIAADTMRVNIRLIWMYGVAKGNGNNGQRLTTI